VPKTKNMEQQPNGSTGEVSTASPAVRHAPRWRRHALGFFVAAFILAQLTVPALGLVRAHSTDATTSAFSWHMFSKVPANAGDE
jgi:cytochrome b561